MLNKKKIIMIEEYFHQKHGYNPFIIRDGWQVAQLNYLPGYGFEEIDRIEVHNKTDEVFVLVKGRAVLIAANVSNEGDIKWDLRNMVVGVTYNIPAGMWHNIAMDKDAQLVIIEKDNTHLQDCTYLELKESQINELKILIQKECE